MVWPLGDTATSDGSSNVAPTEARLPWSTPAVPEVDPAMREIVPADNDDEVDAPARPAAIPAIEPTTSTALAMIPARSPLLIAFLPCKSSPLHSACPPPRCCAALPCCRTVLFLA